MQNIIKNKLVSSIVFFVLGVLLLIAPTDMMKTFSYVIGGVLLVGAFVRLVAYFVTKKENRVPLSLVLGIAAAAAGLLFVLGANIIPDILAYVFGAILILVSLLDLVIAVRLPASKLVAVLLALLELAVGVLVIVNPRAFADIMTRLIGGALIYESVVGIVTVILARKTAKSALLDK